MIITLYGPDSYRRLQKLAEIVGAYKEKYSGFSFARFDLENDDEFNRVKTFIMSGSLFDPVRLVIIDNLLETPDKKEVKTLLKSIEENNETTVIVNSAKKPPATFKFLLEKQSKNQEFPALKGEQLKAFIIKEAELRGIEINTQDISYLSNTFGGDTWGIATEIERMALSRDNKLEKESPSADFFPLINSLKGGYSPKQRLVALEVLLSARQDDPARIFNTLAFRPKDKAESKKYADYDVLVKSGKLEYEEILLALALGL